MVRHRDRRDRSLISLNDESPVPLISMASTIYNKIQTIVNCHISQRYGDNSLYLTKILSALKFLLNGTYDKYQFQIQTCSYIKDELFQESLARVNEKESRRKTAGVFYTDTDVTDYMVLNSFCHNREERER